MLGIGVSIAAFLVILCAHWINKWRNPKCNGVLPPGSMGLPLIGETLELFIPSYSLDTHPFIKKRLERFGSIFRTSLVGRPVVVSADPKLNNSIMQQEGDMVEVYYLDAFSDLFVLEGENRMNVVGSVHKYIRTPLHQFGPQRLKEDLLPEIENLVTGALHKWSRQTSVEVKYASSVLICDYIAKKLFSYEASCDSSSEFSHKLIRISKNAFMSVPLNIPGTGYHKCLKDKDAVTKFLKNIVKERLRSPEVQRGDFLDQAIADLNTKEFLTEDFIITYLFGMLFAGFDATSAVLISALIFLQDNPLVLQELTAEHEELLKRRKNPDAPLTWDEYKSMTFTLQVINETLRLTNVVPGLLRRALKDIHFEGYTIPAGWTILMAIPVCHMNPEIYKDPLTFNPWRWKEIEPHVISKNLMAYGGGTRHCAGAEFSKAFLATFLHVLVTKYRWTKIKGGRFVRNPLFGCNGFFINLVDKQN